APATAGLWFPRGRPALALLRSRFRQASGGLVGRAKLVDRVVVGVGDVRATLRVNCLADEVQQVPIGAGSEAEDPQVTDVPDVHRSRRDLGGGPDGAGRGC